MSSVRRILHVVAPESAGAGTAMLRLIGATRRALPEFEHQVLLVGAAGWSGLAIAAGLGAHRRLPPLLGVPRCSARSIRRAIDAAHPDLIHAWDATSVGLVIAGRPFHSVAATLGAVPPRSGSTPLAQDRVEALCLGERARRQAVAAGWLHARVRAVSPPCVEPPQEYETGAEVRRFSLRRAWGVSESTLVVALVGDPHGAIDGWLAMEMAARAAIAGGPLALVAHPRVACAEALGLWRTLPQLAGLLIEDDRALRPWELFDGLDAVLLTESVGRVPSRGWFDRGRTTLSGPLSLQWALRAGLGVISTRDGPLEGDADPRSFASVAPTANDGAYALAMLRHGLSAQSGARPHPLRRVAPPGGAESMEAWAGEVRALYRRAAVSTVDRCDQNASAARP